MQSKPAPSTPAVSAPHDPVIPPQYLFAFILVTSLFALWGFANDITNPLVKAFQEIFLISNTQSSLVQTAFYGGYGTMAIPAAIFIRRYSYQSGVVVGLALYALGALLFIPASLTMQFWQFLLALYVLTFGLAFLETAANPYVLSMGSPETATRRLNLAQAFNPIGSLVGMVVASNLILANLNVGEFRSQQVQAHPEYAQLLPSQADGKINASLREFRDTHPVEHRQMQSHDLKVIRAPYVAIGLVVLGTMVVFLIAKMPHSAEHNRQVDFWGTLKRLAARKHYWEGVLAQGFYVGAQIMCWTFIIHYAMTLLGLPAATAQRYNIIAMLLFCSSRFICTFLLKYVSRGILLTALAAGAMALTAAAIFVQGMPGLYCLIGISACMSLMFPTIYGIALEGLGQDAKLGSAFLVMAIVGGALMPPLQGRIIDLGSVNLGFMQLEAVRASFVLPLLCFVVVAIYGWRTFRIHDATKHA